MITMDTALAEASRRGLVDAEAALATAHNPEQVRAMAGVRPGHA
jgi:hypothetical protein